MFVPFFHFLSSVFYIAIKSTMSHQDFYKTQLFGFDLRHFLCHTDSLMRWRTASAHFPMNNPVGQWMLLGLDSYPILRLVNRCQFMVSENFGQKFANFVASIFSLEFMNHSLPDTIVTFMCRISWGCAQSKHRGECCKLKQLALCLQTHTNLNGRCGLNERLLAKKKQFTTFNTPAIALKLKTLN